MYARTLPGPENNPNYVNFFYEDDSQLQIQVAPPEYNFISHFILIIKDANQKSNKTDLPMLKLKLKPVVSYSW